VRGRRRRPTRRVGTQQAAVISKRVTGSAARRDGGKTRAGVDMLRRAIGGSQRLHHGSRHPDAVCPCARGIARVAAKKNSMMNYSR